MSKAGNVGRYRPVTALPIQDRVLLRALTNDLAPDLPEPDHSVDSFNTFQRGPLNDGHQYVVAADVASHYFFVDHEQLELRIVDATARADVAEAIRALLTSLFERSFGLPQNFSPSDALAGLSISWVERRLIRAGIPTYRHSDDFRLGASTWGDALVALELLQAEVSAIGLDLNGEKSWILGRELYESNLDLAARLIAEAIAEGGPSFIRVDPYTGDPMEIEEGEDFDEDKNQRMAEAIFERAAAHRLSEERLNGFELRANRDLINSTLFQFRRSRSPVAVERGASVVAIDPAFAHSYALYLSALADDDESDESSLRVLEVIERFEGHAPPWVQAWLIQPLLKQTTSLNAATVDWLQRLLSSSAPEMIRARAALGLAVHGSIDVAELLALFDGFGPAAKPDIVAAIARRSEGADARMTSITESGYLYKWVFEFARENDHDDWL